MNTFHIEGTENSPELYINLKSQSVEINGVSTLKNPNFFYANLSRWIIAFSYGEKKIKTVDIKLKKLNEPSLRWIKFIIGHLNKNADKLDKPVINWYYKDENRLLKKLIEECKSAYNLPSKYIAA